MEKEKYRILIADMVISGRIQSYFGDEIELRQAANGREAIQIFREHHSQIVLLDISMPGIDGLEAAETIRKEDKTCSIIFLTAYDEFDFAKRAIRVRALEYLLKPSTQEELIMVLEEAIQLIRQKQQRKDTLPAEPHEGEERLDLVKNQVMMEAVQEYIEQHYMEDISLQDAAELLHYSDAYFCRFFKQNFHKNFILYLSELRVEKAKELLADVTVNVKDVGQRVGFRDSSYFAKVFKRLTGVTPSEYRYQQ